MDERELHTTPAAFRYILYRPDENPLDGMASKCSSCCVSAIPIGDSMRIHDRWTGNTWSTTRIDATRATMTAFWSGAKDCGYGKTTEVRIGQHQHTFDGPLCVRVSDYRTPLKPTSFGRVKSHDVNEPATVASVVAFLKGATA